MQVDESIKNYSTSTSTFPTTWHFLYLGPSNLCCWKDTGLGRSPSEARKGVRKAVIISPLHNGAAYGGCLSSRGMGRDGVGGGREKY